MYNKMLPASQFAATTAPRGNTAPQLYEYVRADLNESAACECYNKIVAQNGSNSEVDFCSLEKPITSKIFIPLYLCMECTVLGQLSEVFSDMSIS